MGHGQAVATQIATVSSDGLKSSTRRTSSRHRLRGIFRGTCLSDLIDHRLDNHVAGSQSHARRESPRFDAGDHPRSVRTLLEPGSESGPDVATGEWVEHDCLIE